MTELSILQAKLIMFWFYKDKRVLLTGETFSAPMTAEQALETYKDWKNEAPKYKPLYYDSKSKFGPVVKPKAKKS